MTEYVNIKEAVALLRISKSTFHRWRKAGIVPPPVINEGRVRLWKIDALSSSVEKNASAQPDVAGQGMQHTCVQLDDDWSQPEL